MKNIAIIGGGAAGFFAAITAKKQNKTMTFLFSNVVKGFLLRWQ